MRRGVYRQLNSNPRSLQYSARRNCFRAKKLQDFGRAHAPNAPLNTTSYIIRAKKSFEISPFKSSPSPVLNSYGSMKGLLKIRQTGDGTGDSKNICARKLDVRERLGLGLVYSSYNSKNLSRILAVRIRDQGSHIAHLEEESMMLKERVICLEQELVGLKQRMRILELGNAVRFVDLCSDLAITIQINWEVQQRGWVPSIMQKGHGTNSPWMHATTRKSHASGKSGQSLFEIDIASYYASWFYPPY